MGQEVEPRVFTRADRAKFRAKLGRCLETCNEMLRGRGFSEGLGNAGIEIEFDLADAATDPAMRNAEVLRAIGDPSFQTELARFNVEANLAPRALTGTGLEGFEADTRRQWGLADRVCQELGIRLVAIGILPTVLAEHMGIEVLSSDARYVLLNDQIFQARGEDIVIDIEGVERLTMGSDSVAPEAACTSTQLHLQVCPDRYPAYWNAAQAIAGPQVALCANSPFLFGKELWRETRIKLFEQAIDSRTNELVAQGVRPRVWFGERWISSVADLFTENHRYFTPLLPICDEEEPLEALRAGATPALGEMRLHNGTIWRWNRPVYDVMSGKPHLRIENRVLPSGPTVIDTLANAAFWFGLTRRLAEDEDPVWGRLSYDAAAENFLAGARFGMDARMYWPEVGVVGVRELTIRKLLPLAHEGLSLWGISPDLRDRYLEVIERRVSNGRNGAAWQAAVFHRQYDATGHGRHAALRSMTKRYIDLMASGEPVHTWPLD